MFLSHSTTDEAKKLAKVILETPSADPTTKLSAEVRLKRKIRVGEKPVFRFKTVGGREVDTDKMRGKAIILDFWATTCTPCMDFLPELTSLYRTYHNKGLEIVGISFDSDEKRLTRTIKERRILWQNYWEKDAFSSRYAKDCGVCYVPQCLLLDRTGAIREIGADPRESLEEKIKLLLSETP